MVARVTLPFGLLVSFAFCGMSVAKPVVTYVNYYGTETGYGSGDPLPNLGRLSEVSVTATVDFFGYGYVFGQDGTFANVSMDLSLAPDVFGQELTYKTHTLDLGSVPVASDQFDNEFTFASRFSWKTSFSKSQRSFVMQNFNAGDIQWAQLSNYDFPATAFDFENQVFDDAGVYDFGYDLGVTLKIVTAPEPAPIAIIGCAVLGLATRRRPTRVVSR